MLDLQKIIRTFRLSFTCLGLFFITWYYQVPESAWCLITIWVVMFDYSTVGGVFTKALLRFTGTLSSAIYGLVIVYVFGNNPIIDMIALVPGLFIYAYFFMGGDKTYIATIGAVTMTLVLLNYNDVDVAIFRVFNITIGIIASILMIRFFYPQYARDKIMLMQWDFMDHFAGLLERYLEPSKSLAVIKDEFLVYEQAMLEGFITFNRLLDEAKIETRKTPLYITHNKAALFHIRHIFRLLSVFVFYISTEDMRSNAWVCGQLNHLIVDFRAMQRMLGPVDTQYNCIIEKQVSPPKNMQFVETMLFNIKKEMSLLGEEIKKIVLIYSEYPIGIIVV